MGQDLMAFERLKTKVFATLRKNYDRDLGSPVDRRVVATALDEMFCSILNKAICDDCGHLDEVHVGDSCIGGCVTHCSCNGFKHYKP